MPKGTPHPELLLEEYAFVSIGPKGVFTGKDPANSPLEQWRKEGVPENSYMVLRKVDAKTAKLLLEGRAAAVYTDENDKWDPVHYNTHELKKLV